MVTKKFVEVNLQNEELSMVLTMPDIADGKCYIIITEIPINDVATVVEDESRMRKCDIMMLLHDGTTHSGAWLKDIHA